MKIILFIIGLAFCLGLTVGFILVARPEVFGIVLIAGILSIGGSFWALRRKMFVISDVCILTAFLFLGCAWAIQEEIIRRQILVSLRAVPSVVTMVGIVEAPSSGTMSFEILRPRLTEKNGKTRFLPIPVIIRDHAEGSVRSGSVYAFTGKIRIREQDGRARVFLDSQRTDFSRKSIVDHFVGACMAFSNGMRVSIKEYLSPASYAFFSAFFFGDRGLLSRPIKAAFKNTGTYHILSISGLHVGIFFFFAHFSLKLFRVPYKVRLLCSLFAVIVYALMSGCSLPTQRACVMIAVFVASYFARRTIHPLQTLGIALLAVLMMNPLSVHMLGFWLSFLSVFCIIAGFTVVPFKRPPTPLETLLYTSFFASVATAPLILKYFNTFPWVGILLNVLIVPLSAVILFAGVSGMCLLLIPPLAQHIFLALDALIRLNLFIVAEAGKWGVVFFPGEKIPWTVLIVFYGLILIGVVRRVGWKQGMLT